MIYPTYGYIHDDERWVGGNEVEEKEGTAMVYKRDCKAEEGCQWG